MKHILTTLPLIFAVSACVPEDDKASTTYSPPSTTEERVSPQLPSTAEERVSPQSTVLTNTDLSVQAVQQELQALQLELQTAQQELQAVQQEAQAVQQEAQAVQQEAQAVQQEAQAVQQEAQQLQVVEQDSVPVAENTVTRSVKGMSVEKGRLQAAYIPGTEQEEPAAYQLKTTEHTRQHHFHINTSMDMEGRYGGNVRSEISSVQIQRDKAYTIEFDANLTGWPDFDTWVLVFQIHAKPDQDEASRTPILALEASAGNYTWSIRKDQNRMTSGKTPTVLNLPIPITDETIHWKIETKLMYNEKGYTRIYADGKLVLKYSGANTYNDSLHPYMKIGIYAEDPQKDNWGHVSELNMIHTNVIVNGKAI